MSPPSNDDPDALPPLAATDLSDAMLADALADPEIREIMETIAGEIDAAQPLSAMDAARQKEILLEAIQVMNEIDDESGDDLPDELIEEIFADPEAQPMLVEAMSEAGIAGRPADLAADERRDLVVALIAAGVIVFDDDEDGEDL